MNNRLEHLVKRFPELESVACDIQATFDLMRDCYRDGGKLLLCGNGGSAADAEHWVGELLKGFCSRRPLTKDQRKNLEPDTADKLQQALPAIPLTGFTSLSTAFNNDVDPNLTFAQLVWGLGNCGDVLVGLTTSGNSGNVLAAAKVARTKGLKVVGMTGSSGGKLKDLSDVCIKVPACETYMIQEYHLPIYHALCLMLEDEFFEA